MDRFIASSMFKALSDDKRLKIVKVLYHGGEKCACCLLEMFDCSQSTLSHHMKILVDASLVIAREEGKWTHYSANKEKIDELMSFIETPCACKCSCEG